MQRIARFFRMMRLRLFAFSANSSAVRFRRTKDVREPFLFYHMECGGGKMNSCGGGIYVCRNPTCRENIIQHVQIFPLADSRGLGHTLLRIFRRVA